MNASQLINQDSGEFEYGTDPIIVEAARATLGGCIELDPASAEWANKTIKALVYFTKADDGLALEWYANTVWMNHPFSREGNPPWIKKMIQEFEAGHFVAGCCITFASTSEGWFKPLMRFPQCYLQPRTNYYLPNGTKKIGVTKGSVVTYFGPAVAAFKRNFKDLGSVMFPA